MANGKPLLQAMPTGHAIRILDEAAALGFREVVAFHHMSEAFLDARVIDMAWETRKRGMHPRVQIVKNLEKGSRTQYPLCAKCPRPPTVAYSRMHRIRSRMKIGTPVKSNLSRLQNLGR